MYHKLIKNQPEVTKLLQNSFKKNRLVHTYLFHGAKGTMKMEAARYFSSLLLCENDGACGVCNECISIHENRNPNLFIIKPDGNSIKKEQIMELEHEFSRLSDQKRVFIVEDIDKATASTANSLLKFIEEAGENNYGVLITENINLVIPTIKSRSQNVSFKLFSRDAIKEELIDKKINSELASIIATLTNDPEEAYRYSQDKTFVEVVNIVKDLGMSFENSDLNPIVVFNSQSKALYGNGKQYQEQFLSLLITLQNDKIKYMNNPELPLVFDKLLRANDLRLEQSVEIKILEILMDLKVKTRYNLNVELAYLHMLIGIVRCING
jgi:DNA polymerase-3 subunit delta'